MVSCTRRSSSARSTLAPSTNAEVHLREYPYEHFSAVLQPRLVRAVSAANLVTGYSPETKRVSRLFFVTTERLPRSPLLGSNPHARQTHKLETAPTSPSKLVRALSRLVESQSQYREVGSTTSAWSARARWLTRKWRPAAWGRLRRRFASRGRAFAGFARRACRWDSARAQSGISPSHRPWRRPTCRWGAR